MLSLFFVLTVENIKVRNKNWQRKERILHGSKVKSMKEKKVCEKFQGTGKMWHDYVW